MYLLFCWFLTILYANTLPSMLIRITEALLLSTSFFCFSVEIIGLKVFGPRSGFFLLDFSFGCRPQGYSRKKNPNNRPMALVVIKNLV